MTTEQFALLAGGDPRIAKGKGEAPVQAYLAALPGWKQAVGVRVDALILSTVPHMHQAANQRPGSTP